MSILSNLLTGGAFDFLGKVLDKIFPDPEARRQAELKVLEMVQAGELAQLEVNAIEARHESVFVAGWRPFIGWVCGFLIAAHNIIALHTGVSIFDPAMLPDLDSGDMITVLLGMLGLGGLRTFEKYSGVNTARGNPTVLHQKK
jgi:hypothetical protein